MTISQKRNTPFKLTGPPASAASAKLFTVEEVANILAFIRSLRGVVDELLEKGYTINADGTWKPPSNPLV
jgi:uncharacterized protein YkvS